MAFVPGYEHDIFVSYASVNDQPRGTDSKGWVTNFITELKKGLDWRIGDQDACDVWSAHELAGNAPISAQLLEHAGASATLIMVLSQAYVNSPWCHEAQAGFLDTIRNYARADSRIFVVRLDKTECPQPLHDDVDGYQFFEEDPNSGRIHTLGFPQPKAEYYTSIDDLSADLVRELNALQPLPATASATPAVLPAVGRQSPGAAPSATVLLAEGTDDLYFQRNEVKHYLEQANIAVLPRVRYPREPDAFRAALRRDLDACDCFVQLLGSVPFQEFPDLPQGPVRCQFDLAWESGKPVIQWRSPELDVQQAVSDALQRDFLQSEHVYATALESFKAEIVRQLMPRQRPAAKQRRKTPLVVVSKHEHDVGLADRICRMLQEEFQVSYNSPLATARRESIVKRLKRCDGLVLVYGRADLEWMEDYFDDVQDILPERDRPLAALAVYDGPPEEKPDITFGAPGMLLMKCRDCFGEDQLREFVKKLYV